MKYAIANNKGQLLGFGEKAGSAWFDTACGDVFSTSSRSFAYTHLDKVRETTSKEFTEGAQVVEL